MEDWRAVSSFLEPSIGAASHQVALTFIQPSSANAVNPLKVMVPAYEQVRNINRSVPLAEPDNPIKTGVSLETKQIVSKVTR